MKVVVVGAAGHVGLPFTLMVMPAFRNTVGLDTNQDAVDKLNAGVVPFIEEDAKEYLDLFKPLFTTDNNTLRDADIIAIMIGTPVDEEGNPRIDGISHFIEAIISPLLREKCGKLIILRSTVSPGTTKMLKEKLESLTRLKEGIDFHLVFCPERVAQGVGITESLKFPQIIGAFTPASVALAGDFFSKIFYPRTTTTIILTPIEAELAKLMTNMYRYVNFALANEFMMIANSHNSNAKKIFNAVNQDYPRANIPMPGPNVGGPCLFKDGKFLLDGISYPELIRTSFDINEGMPDYIYSQMKTLTPHASLRNVLVLGAAFKANNDDTRNSLSFKMRKVLKQRGINVTLYDPLVAEYSVYKKARYDAVIVMTPHSIFKDWFTKTELELSQDTIIVDIWKLFPESDHFINGMYHVGDYRFRYRLKSNITQAMQGE